MVRPAMSAGSVVGSAQFYHIAINVNSVVVMICLDNYQSVGDHVNDIDGGILLNRAFDDRSF